MEAGRYDPAVVDDDQVTLVEPIRQLLESAVVERVLSPVDHQQSRGVSASGWTLCDEGVRQLKIEVGKLHRFSIVG